MGSCNEKISFIFSVHQLTVKLVHFAHSTNNISRNNISLNFPVNFNFLYFYFQKNSCSFLCVCIYLFYIRIIRLVAQTQTLFSWLAVYLKKKLGYMMKLPVQCNNIELFETQFTINFWLRASTTNLISLTCEIVLRPPRHCNAFSSFFTTPGNKMQVKLRSKPSTSSDIFQFEGISAGKNLSWIQQVINNAKKISNPIPTK